MLIVMFITAVETTGDVFATGEIVGKPIRRKDIARAVRADGLATTLGGVLNSFPYTAFAENVGLVRLTRVKSRYVVAAAAGVFMIVLGLLPKVAAVVAAIPSGRARRRRDRDVRHRRGDRHPDALARRLPRRPQRDHRRRLARPGDDPGRVPDLLPALRRRRADDRRQRHHDGLARRRSCSTSRSTCCSASRPAVEVGPPPRPALARRGQRARPTRSSCETFASLFQGEPRDRRRGRSTAPVRQLYELRRAFHDALFDADDEAQRSS